MNRYFLEQLMYFKKQAEINVDNIQESLKECDAVMADKAEARLLEANATLAYIGILLDTYWDKHNGGKL